MNEFIVDAILTMGYGFLTLLLFIFLRALLIEQVDWGDFFSNNAGESHHLSRYVVVFGTMLFAFKFLFTVINAENPNDITSAYQFTDSLDLNAITGGSGAAYLLGKATNGDILSLFGKRS